MRKTTFASGEFYHIYNRGVDKRTIFSDQHDLDRFLQSMREFNNVEPIGSIFENSFRQLGGETAKLKRLVKVIAYCLNPNHYHFILQQISEGGISEYMKRLGGGYTWHFNHRHKRNGALFQGTFKSIHVDSNEYLLHLSVYVNLNYKVHKLNAGSLTKSSFLEYVKQKQRARNSILCSPSVILSQFPNIKEYKAFASESLKDILERKNLSRELAEYFFE